MRGRGVRRVLSRHDERGDAAVEQIGLLEGQFGATAWILTAVTGGRHVHDIGAFEERRRSRGDAVAIGEDRLDHADVDTEMRLVGVSGVMAVLIT